MQLPPPANVNPSPPKPCAHGDCEQPQDVEPDHDEVERKDDLADGEQLRCQQPLLRSIAVMNRASIWSEFLQKSQPDPGANTP